MVLNLVYAIVLLALTTRIEERGKNEAARSQSSTSIEQYNRLISWLKTFPTAYVSPCIRIGASDRGGHGAFAKECIPKDTKLLSIPREACITSNIVVNDEDIGEALEGLIKKAGPGSFTVALSGYLAKEYLCHKNGKESDFGPYLDTLSWERGWNGQEHVLFWSEEDVALLLEGSLCYKESIDLRAEVQVAKRVLNSLIGPAVLRERNPEKPLVPFLSWTKPPAPKVTTPIPGLGEAVTAAFVILLTRSFGDDFDEGTNISKEGTEKLVPLLDMLNHDNEPSIRHKTVADGSVEVIARRDLVVGEELYNRYKEEEELNMPKHRFFTRFGFVPGAVDDVKALFTNKSSIFFAKKAEI